MDDWMYVYLGIGTILTVVTIMSTDLKLPVISKIYSIVLFWPLYSVTGVFQDILEDIFPSIKHKKENNND